MNLLVDSRRIARLAGVLKKVHRLRIKLKYWSGGVME
jgi:hypothetical protein